MIQVYVNIEQVQVVGFGDIDWIQVAFVEIDQEVEASQGYNGHQLLGLVGRQWVVFVHYLALANQKALTNFHQTIANHEAKATPKANLVYQEWGFGLLQMLLEGFKVLQEVLGGVVVLQQVPWGLGVCQWLLEGFGVQ